MDEKKTSSRILTAIVFADIYGYTAMMQKDEPHALEIRNRFKKILEDNVENFEGKIIQFYGDGALMIFTSGLKAAEFAIKLQQEAADEPKVPVKTAIHMGDVVYDNEGIFGDGVNVTSRIESVCHPGSVLISDKLRDMISNQPHIITKSLGKVTFKNVAKEIEIFAIINEGLVNPDSISSDGKFSQKKDEPAKSSNKKYFYGIGVLVLIAAIIFSVIHFTKEKNQTEKEIPLKKEDTRKQVEDYLSRLYNPASTKEQPNILLADNFAIKGANEKNNPFASEYKDTAKNKLNVLQLAGIQSDEFADKNYSCSFTLHSKSDSIQAKLISEVMPKSNKIKIISIEYTNVIALKKQEQDKNVRNEIKDVKEKKRDEEKLTEEEKKILKRNIKRRLQKKIQ